MGTDYRKAKKHSALQQWTEKHMGHFCCYAFLHHLIIKRSIACNCLHLSQLLRKIKPPRFLPLQSWTVHKQVSDAVLSSFFSLPNTNYSAVVVVSTQKKKKKDKMPFHKKTAGSSWWLLTTKLKGWSLAVVRKEQSQNSVPGQASKGHARTARSQTSLSSQVLACRHIS